MPSTFLQVLAVSLGLILAIVLSIRMVQADPLQFGVCIPTGGGQMCVGQGQDRYRDREYERDHYYRERRWEERRRWCYYHPYECRGGY